MFYIPDEDDYEFLQNNQVSQVSQQVSQVSQTEITQSTQSTQSTKTTELVDYGLTCSICLSEEFNNDMCITNCKHIFHLGCLEKLNERDIHFCPNCRNEDYIYLLLSLNKKQIEIFNTKMIIKNNNNLFEIANQIIDENIKSVENMLKNNINIKISRFREQIINDKVEEIKNIVLNKVNLLDIEFLKIFEDKINEIAENNIEKIFKQKYKIIENTLKTIDEKVQQFLDKTIDEKVEKILEQKMEKILKQKVSNNLNNSKLNIINNFKEKCCLFC